ncbi:MAG: amidohydrolase family protein [Bacteroidota bacterium]|nr:amidohydrolase family protein [Bacteroidota bacterium]
MKKIYFNIDLNKILFGLIGFIWSASLSFSQKPAANFQQEEIAIINAKIHVGNGQILEKSILLFAKGIIKYIGTNETNLKKSTIIIDAMGKEIYPGFIAPVSTIGLAEIGMVAATIDDAEVGSINTSSRAIIAYNTDSKVIPTLRSNGVLTAQVVPSGGRISGQSSIVELEAWNWEDAAYKIDEGIHINWPGMYRYNEAHTESGRSLINENYKKETQELEDYFYKAKAYNSTAPADSKHLEFEAMLGLWSGSKQLYIHAQLAKQIIQAVLFCKKFNLVCVIVGGKDAWRVSDFLKEHNTAVILDRTHSLPMREDEDVDQVYKNAATLQAAGVLYCLSDEGYWQQRNLAFQAGQSKAYGLTYEQALSAITLNTAKILGIADKTGSIEIGKEATFFISQGDALDMKTQLVTQAFIRGREIDLDDHQKALYRKFRTKYQSK